MSAEELSENCQWQENVTLVIYRGEQFPRNGLFFQPCSLPTTSLFHQCRFSPWKFICKLSDEDKSFIFVNTTTMRRSFHSNSAHFAYRQRIRTDKFITSFFPFFFFILRIKFSREKYTRFDSRGYCVIFQFLFSPFTYMYV